MSTTAAAATRTSESPGECPSAYTPLGLRPYSPMQVRSYCREGVVWLQRKIDGWRLTISKVGHGGVPVFRAETRSGRDLTARLVRTPVQQVFDRMPIESVLDGELHVEGGGAEDVPGAIASRSQKLRFTAFAVPVWAGVDCRRMSVLEAAGLAAGAGIPFVATTLLTPGGKVAKPDVATLRVEAARLGIEGWVLGCTHCGPRFKVKPVMTADMVVESCGPVSAKLVMPASTHVAEVVCQGVVIGDVVEVMYSGLRRVHGFISLVSPAFVRIREDKSAAQCTHQQFAGMPVAGGVDR